MPILMTFCLLILTESVFAMAFSDQELMVALAAVGMSSSTLSSSSNKLPVDDANISGNLSFKAFRSSLEQQKEFNQSISKQNLKRPTADTLENLNRQISTYTLAAHMSEDNFKANLAAVNGTLTTALAASDYDEQLNMAKSKVMQEAKSLISSIDQMADSFAQKYDHLITEENSLKSSPQTPATAQELLRIEGEKKTNAKATSDLVIASDAIHFSLVEFNKTSIPTSIPGNAKKQLEYGLEGLTKVKSTLDYAINLLKKYKIDASTYSSSMDNLISLYKGQLSITVNSDKVTSKNDENFIFLFLLGKRAIASESSELNLTPKQKELFNSFVAGTNAGLNHMGGSAYNLARYFVNQSDLYFEGAKVHEENSKIMWKQVEKLKKIKSEMQFSITGLNQFQRVFSFFSKLFDKIISHSQAGDFTCHNPNLYDCQQMKLMLSKLQNSVNLSLKHHNLPSGNITDMNFTNSNLLNIKDILLKRDSSNKNIKSNILKSILETYALLTYKKSNTSSKEIFNLRVGPLAFISKTESLKSTNQTTQGNSKIDTSLKPNTANKASSKAPTKFSDNGESMENSLDSNKLDQAEISKEKDESIFSQISKKYLLKIKHFLD